MAHSPPTASQPTPTSHPSYGSITASPDLESQTNLPFLPPPSGPSSPACPHCAEKDPRGWIHVLLGLQGARDPSYNEDDFIFTLWAAFVTFLAVMALTMIIIFVPDAGSQVIKLIFIAIGVMALFTAFPAPWCGDRCCA